MPASRHLGRGSILVVIAVLLVGLAVHGGGIGAGLSVCTIDISSGLAKIPTAVESSLADIIGVVEDMEDIPQSELDELIEDFEGVQEDVSSALEEIPDTLPLPMIGGSLGFSLPFVVVDEIQFSVSALTNELVLAVIQAAADVDAEDLLPIEGEIEGLGTVEISPSLSNYMLSTELVKRFDFLLGAADIGLGINIVSGSINPNITVVSSDYQDQINDVLSEFHLDQLTWSAFSGQVSVGIELGPPFLRLRINGRYLLPITQAASWWELDVGNIAGDIGLVIRF